MVSLFLSHLLPLRLTKTPAQYGLTKLLERGVDLGDFADDVSVPGEPFEDKTDALFASVRLKLATVEGVTKPTTFLRTRPRTTPPLRAVLLPPVLHPSWDLLPMVTWNLIRLSDHLSDLLTDTLIPLVILTVTDTGKAEYCQPSEETPSRLIIDPLSNYESCDKSVLIFLDFLQSALSLAQLGDRFHPIVIIW